MLKHPSFLRSAIAASVFFTILSCLHAEQISDLGSINCVVDNDKSVTNCDYSYSSSQEVKNVSLKVGDAAVQIADKGISPYPVEGQSSAILFLVDVSDPNRAGTVEVKNKQHLVEMLLQQKPYQKTGIAVFDSEISVLSPIGSDQTENIKAVNQIKARGQATEFYKNILAAIQILKNTDATRKGLVLISDGKDEDRAYKSEDVLKAAKDANVVILGLGYTEKPSDTPYLQTMKRLSDGTRGAFLDATNAKLPKSFIDNPFDFLERGGRVSFDSSTFYGNNDVHLILGLASGQPLDLTTAVNFPDKRGAWEKFSDFIKNSWLYILIGALLLTFLVWGLIILIQKRNTQKQDPTVYAYLSEYDGLGTRHEINKTAICIGRSKDNDICLVNDSISSHHAEIHRRREGSFYIVDLASTNGVLVNESKVDQTELKDGDIIELGEVRFVFQQIN
jgi:FHA domain/von Willebrand factor type A domain